MNYQRLLKLFWEFAEKLEEQHTLYLDSIAGYSILHDRIVETQGTVKKILGEHEYASTEFQDTCTTIYSQFSDLDVTPISMSPVMKQGDVKTRTKHNGINCLMLANQCIVSLYSYWEEYLRIEVAIAIGVLPEGSKSSDENKEILNQHVTSDVWGDIRLLRNSIVHHNGVATKDIRKCKIITCFQKGDLIEIHFDLMQIIFRQLGIYRNKLHSMSLPKQTLQIPIQK